MELEHFSASRVALFEQCPLRYHAEYELGLASVPHHLTLMGSCVHYMFERAVNSAIGKESGPVDPFMHEEQAIKSSGMKNGDVPLMRELVGNAVKWGWMENLDKVLGIELEIGFHVAGTKVTGKIDRLDRNGAFADIKDLKTQKRLFDEKYLKNNWQACVYNIGARKLFPDLVGPVTVSFWVLRHSIQRVELTQEDADRGEERIAAAIAEIRDCEVPKANPSGLCPWCPYYEKCEAGNGKTRQRIVVPFFDKPKSKPKPKQDTLTEWLE